MPVIDNRMTNRLQLLRYYFKGQQRNAGAGTAGFKTVGVSHDDF